MELVSLPSLSSKDIKNVRTLLENCCEKENIFIKFSNYSDF